MGQNLIDFAGRAKLTCRLVSTYSLFLNLTQPFLGKAEVQRRAPQLCCALCQHHGHICAHVLGLLRRG